MARPKKNVTKTSTASEKPLDLATAKVATGETQSPTLMALLEKNMTPHFAAASIEEYSKKINAMNLPDLQNHAFEVGEIPLSRRDVLIDRLERRFLEHKGRANQASVIAKFAQDDLTPEARARLTKIMRDGAR